MDLCNAGILVFVPIKCISIFCRSRKVQWIWFQSVSCFFPLCIQFFFLNFPFFKSKTTTTDQIFGVGIAFPIILDILINVIPSFKTVLENLAIYGYSYAIFIPVLILCTIPNNVSWFFLAVRIIAHIVRFCNGLCWCMPQYHRYCFYAGLTKGKWNNKPQQNDISSSDLL